MMRRSIERWQASNPHAMAHQQSRVAIEFAFDDARVDILALHSRLMIMESAEQTQKFHYDAMRRRAQDLEALAERVAKLNPRAGVIGAGMLTSLIEHARRLTELES
jgi:hypothetical protein